MTKDQPVGGILSDRESASELLIFY